MPTYVAMLRGINLGSRKRVAMADLVELFTGLGHTDVSTYLQSGNVVFTSRRKDQTRLSGQIERQLEDHLGFPVTVVVRSGAEMAGVVERTPFLDREGSPASLHVTFLAGEPKGDGVARIDPAVYAPDEFAVVGREVHLHCPNGYGRSKLDNAFWEKRLGVAATTRNWKTVTSLVERAAG